MEKFIVEATKSSPSICFDPQTCTLEITGESYPENSSLFYEPLFDLLEEYLEADKNQNLEVNMQIIYFNSSSSKAFMNLFEMLDSAVQRGKKIVVNWRYHEENDTALECGEEFMEDVEGLVFNLVEIPGK